MEKSLKSIMKKEYSAIYNLYSDVNIKIVSNSEQGLMKEYFSSAAIRNNTNKTGLGNYIIYLIDKPLNELDVSVLDKCKNSSLRAKRIFNGYYNLHHFGDSVGFYRKPDSSVFYVFGAYKFSKKVVWSYLIKWILTESCLNSKVHLKASCLSINGKGYLILGDKSSGKSTLISALMKEIDDIYFISNTHVIVDQKIAYGVKSNINFRKDVARQIQKEYDVLNDIEIKTCTNIDPLLLDYKIAENCRIDTIIFYQFSDDFEYQVKRVNDEDMLALLNLYSDGNSFYNLQNDLMNYYGGDVSKVADLCMFNNDIKKNMLSNAKKYIITANTTSFSEVVGFIKGSLIEK